MIIGSSLLIRFRLRLIRLDKKNYSSNFRFKKRWFVSVSKKKKWFVNHKKVLTSDSDLSKREDGVFE